jgi:hypothetical protein
MYKETGNSVDGIYRDRQPKIARNYKTHRTKRKRKTKNVLERVFWAVKGIKSQVRKDKETGM